MFLYYLALFLALQLAFYKVDPKIISENQEEN